MENKEIKKGKLITVRFTEEEFLALREFYSRVTLSGLEAPTYLMVKNKIDSGKIENGGVENG